MPWEIKKNDDKFCVFKKGGKDPLKCYDDEDKAKEYMSALYASYEEGKSFGLKMAKAEYEIYDEDGQHCIYEQKDGKKGKKVACHDDREDAEEQLAAIMVAETRDEKSFKMASYNAMINEVCEAWGQHSDYDYRSYVHEVYPDYCTVSTGRKKYWKVPYTRNGEEITFADNNEWKEVEGKKEWVEKRVEWEEVNSPYAVKAVGEDRVRAYGILFGSEEERDLHDEYFTDETEEVDVIFKSIGKIPWLFHHGADETLKTVVVGHVDRYEKDDLGWWYEAKITEHEIYKQYVEPLVKKKKLFSSSGTLPGAKRSTPDGKILRWPTAEMTGTHIPAEYRMLQRPISDIKSAYKSIDVNELPFADEEGEVAKGVEEARLALNLRQRELELLELEV